MKQIVLSLALFTCTSSIYGQNLIPLDEGNSSTGAKIYNGNGTLGKSYDFSKCGLNFAFTRVAVSKRNTTTTGTGLPAPINITGVPTLCTTIEKAFLYAVVAHNAADPSPPTFTVTNTAFAVSNFTATQIGADVEKCWGELQSRTYRADITSAIDGSGNGIYSINTNVAVADVDGFLLFIIYSDDNMPYTGRMILFDGCNSDNAGASATQNLILSPPPCANSTFAQAFNLVSDCQYPAVIVHQSTLNGATANYTDNFFNFDVVNTNVTAGQATAAYGVKPGNGGVVSDCYAWALMGMYYQTTTCAQACAGGCLTVPLELLYFNGKKTDKGVSLDWATASEKKSARFEIERSTDGNTFSTIASLPAAGQSTTLKRYNYPDVGATAGTALYYRLKTIDQDEYSQVSKIVSLLLPLHGLYASISYEGLVTAKLQINAEERGLLDISLYNTVGRQVFKQQFEAQTGSNSYDLDLSILSAGMYLLEIRDANGKVQQLKLRKID